MSQRYQTGVYEIVCAANNMRYVGGTQACILNRFSVHRFLLRRNCHHNKHLQKDWNLYGEKQFDFHIVKLCSKAQVHFWEQQFIDFWLEEDFLYNEQPLAGSSVGSQRTKEQRLRQSIAARKRCTPEWKRAVSQRVKLQHKAGKLGRQTWRKG